MVAKNPALGVLRHLRFCNPDHFQVGSLHVQLAIWEKLLCDVSHEQVDVMAIINEGVNIEQSFTWCKGDFKGKSFDSEHPPPIVLENSKSCTQFSDFISATILQWVSAWLFAAWGKIGQVTPPLPCLFHDEHYLNLWIKDLPFKLDHLSHLTRYVLPGHYQTTFDKKSGYQYIYLHPSSHTFFSLQVPIGLLKHPTFYFR